MGINVLLVEDDPLVRTTLRELNLLRQEAKARVDSLRARFLDCSNNFVDHQIGFRRWCCPYKDLLVGHLNGHRIAVRFGIDDHGLHTHPAASLDDANSDFAAICNQNLIKHLGPRAPEVNSLNPGSIMSATG